MTLKDISEEISDSANLKYNLLLLTNVDEEHQNIYKKKWKQRQLL